MSTFAEDRAGRGQYVMIEVLELRRLLAAAVAPTPTLDSNGILTVTGTAHADDITISLENADATKLDVNVDGTVTTFNTADVKGIAAIGASGSDDIEIDQSNGAIDVPVTMAGGNGNDTLVGG